MNGQFLQNMQRYIANISIGPSTLRNQGAKGVKDAAIDFLATMDLNDLQLIEEGEQEEEKKQYIKQLNRWTNDLMEEFPEGARQNFGAARKALNIFSFKASLNQYLDRKYKISRFHKYMEVPLDSKVASGLTNCPNGDGLPEFETIRRTDPQLNQQYQEVAILEAERLGLPGPVFLDILYWPAERD